MEGDSAWKLGREPRTWPSRDLKEGRIPGRIRPYSAFAIKRLFLLVITHPLNLGTMRSNV
jgi:hypothetical protein